MSPKTTPIAPTTSTAVAWVWPVLCAGAAAATAFIGGRGLYAALLRRTMNRENPCRASRPSKGAFGRRAIALRDPPGYPPRSLQTHEKNEKSLPVGLCLRRLPVFPFRLRHPGRAPAGRAIHRPRRQPRRARLAAGPRHGPVLGAFP